MDIRTKLVFALVAVALGSMLALGAVLYTTADETIREGRLAQIDGLAESRKDAVQHIVSGWRDRVRLISSRTQLRESLRLHGRRPGPEVVSRITRILDDVRAAVGIVESVTVFDTAGRPVAVSGRSGEADPLGGPESSSEEDVALKGFSVDASGAPRVTLEAALAIGDTVVGSLRVILDARALVELTADRTSLGTSGETVVIIPGPDGSPRALVAAGFPPTGTEQDPLLALAAVGVDGVHWRGVRDSSGTPVWVATRGLPGLGWTVMVKVDAAEARAPVRAFRDRLLRIAVALGAFAILVGTVLGLRFARPIHDLAEVARRVGGGELHARAQVHAEDEVGLLARTFNEMAAGLENRVVQLREFERFFDVSLDMMCIAGTDGFFKRVNPALTRVLGRDEDDLLARPFLDFIHPDDVEMTLEEIERLGQGIPTISFENRFLRSDGSYRVIAWTAHPDPATGLLYAIARDVTGQQRNRERGDDHSRRPERVDGEPRTEP